MQITTPLVNQFLRTCVTKRLSPHTLKAYRIDLAQIQQYFQEKEISKSNLTTYISSLSNSYKAKSVKRKLASLNVFFEYLVFEELIEQNPLLKVKHKIKEEKRLPSTINLSDLCIIFTSAQASRNILVQRDLAVLETLISTGIRVSELCSIKINDINFAESYIKVNGKGSKERIVYLNDSVKSILYDYYHHFKSPIDACGYLFINKHHKPLSDQSVRSMIKKYSMKVFKHITPHMFRHTFATMLLEQEVDISYIQKILGHSSITTTAIYAYASNAKQKDILKNKNPRQMLSSYQDIAKF